eukprot:TRINITY_DN6614_c0_g1_i2.p1 TRINITY_DN6614_c0_g1~~TRINITY_DN6614_c0_g1_i2.p1  ORF type:complete len:435 (+),score=18.71 TRINITY_DN6614_c0_g1_i2:56-1306(+)
MYKINSFILLLFSFLLFGFGELSRVLEEAGSVGQLSLTGYNLNDDRLYISYNLILKQARLMTLDTHESSFIPSLAAFQGRQLKQDNSESESQLSVLRVDQSPSTSNEGIDVTSSGIPLLSILEADLPPDNRQSISIQTDEQDSDPSGVEIIETTDGQVQFIRNDSIVESTGSSGVQGNKDLETILGKDERTLVLDTTAYPFRTIGRLSFMCQEFEGQCTATLVGPRTIITSAHCVINKSNLQDNCTDYKFSPGQLASVLPYGTVNVLEYKLPSSWLTNMSSENDYVIMTLESDIGLQVGWMSFGFDCEMTVQNLTTAGYPADKDEATSMYTTKCKELPLQACSCFGSVQDTCSEKSGIFKHSCDTYKGQSGSPLWSSERGFPQIRGIHSAGSSISNQAAKVGHIVFGFFRDFMMEN